MGLEDPADASELPTADGGNPPLLFASSEEKISGIRDPFIHSFPVLT